MNSIAASSSKIGANRFKLSLIGAVRRSEEGVIADEIAAQFWREF